MPHRRSRLRNVLSAMAVLAVVGSTSAYAAIAIDSQAPAVTRDALAATDSPAGAKGKTLGLSRVDVPAGAKLALHRHPGTQVARIDSGVLTYTVVTGHVDVMRGSPEAKPERVRRIAAGQTAKIRAGQWIVERPGTIHRAANKGAATIVIYLATLFKTGSPPAIPVER